jgi:hypothetical protein
MGNQQSTESTETSLTVSSKPSDCLTLFVSRLHLCCFVVREDFVVGRDRVGVISRVYLRRSRRFFCWKKAHLIDGEPTFQQSEYYRGIERLPKLELPYVMKYFGTFRDAHLIYVLMEYCHGKSLRALLEHRRAARVQFSEDVSLSFCILVFLLSCFSLFVL